MTVAAHSLRGYQILITRPQPQADGFARLVSACAGDSLVMPLVEITYLSNDHQLAACLDQLGPESLAIFVSVHAVRAVMAALVDRDQVPATFFADKQVAAIGPATASLLEDSGVGVMFSPQQPANSENLLTMLPLDRVGSQEVVIFRGQAGRELLEKTLKERGAIVRYATCYQRVSTTSIDSAALTNWLAAPFRIVTLTSVEITNALLARVIGPQRVKLLETPVAALSDRIAQCCQLTGFSGPIAVASAATPVSLLQAVLDCKQLSHG